MYKSLVFASIVCLVCSILLAIAASSLKPFQDYNVSIDQKKNILKSLKYLDDFSMEGTLVEKLYQKNVIEVVIDRNGNIIAGKTIADAQVDDKLLYLYETKDRSAIVIPVEGMGLWSTLLGYLALENDGHTIKGITFYEQKETPGLGAEIATNWFTGNFNGKNLKNSQGEWVSVTVAKGKARDLAGIEDQNKVDGISGATMTSRGVTDLLYQGMEDYKNYLRSMRGN